MYPAQNSNNEPLGIEFEHYKKYLAAGEIEYLSKVEDDKRPARPVSSFFNSSDAPTTTKVHPPSRAAANKQATDTTDSTTDSPSTADSAFGDEEFSKFLDSFDVDGAIAGCKEPPPPPPASIPSRQRKHSPSSSTNSTPSPASKKARYESGGAAVYNRKEGNRSTPSPIQFTVQRPMHVGQNDRLATVMTHLASSGTPKDNITITGTARAIMDTWNHVEFSSRAKGDMPLGTMTIGVAESISRDITNDCVKARANGSNLSARTFENGEGNHRVESSFGLTAISGSITCSK